MVSLFERCSAFTRVTTCEAERPQVTRYIAGFSHFVSSVTDPTPSGWSESCRVGLSPTVTTPPYQGAQPERTSWLPATFYCSRRDTDVAKTVTRPPPQRTGNEPTPNQIA